MRAEPEPGYTGPAFSSMYPPGGRPQRLATERWALVPLRLLIGFGFAAHDFAKLTRGVDFC